MNPADLQALGQLARQLLDHPAADPRLLADAIERLILLQTLQTLANPDTSAPDRAAALHTFHQWRQADLARQRLALENAKLQLARDRFTAESQQAQAAAENASAPADPLAFADDPAAQQAIVAKLDEIIGLKPPSPPPPPPPPPAPP
jgi:hypothetical protein